MRKLIVSLNVTLNGFMAGPNGNLDWHMPYWDEEMSRVTSAQLRDADTILLGRVTYIAMARYWPAQQVSAYAAREDIGFADMMNSYEKVVFSKTLKAVSSWTNSRLAKRSVAVEINELKLEPGKKNIIVYGSGTLTAALTRQNLVDEYHLWIHPVAIERGRSLFQNLRNRLNVRLYKTKVFNTGVVLLCYEVVR